MGVFILLFSATVLICVAVHRFIGKGNVGHDSSYPSFDVYDEYND